MKYRHTKKYLLALAIVLAFVASQVIGFVSSHFPGAINAYYLQIAIFVGINVTLAVGLNLINGYTGQFSLGHAGFMAIGAYVASYLSMEHSAGIFRVLGGANPWSIAVVFPLMLIAGGLAAALAGLVVGIPSLRLKGDYLAIVTLGFGEIIRVLIQNTDAVGGPRGLSGIAVYTNLFWTYAIAAITIYVVVSLIDSTYGRGFLTVRDDEIAAEAVGISTTRYKVTAFVLGAFFAGIAGGLYAHSTTYINPSGFDFQLSILIVTMVILGGMGSTIGVTIAAIALTLFPEGLRMASSWHGQIDISHLGKFPPDWFYNVMQNRMIFFSILLIALMLLRPQGLFGMLPRRAAERKIGPSARGPKEVPAA